MDNRILDTFLRQTSNRSVEMIEQLSSTIGPTHAARMVGMALITLGGLFTGFALQRAQKTETHMRTVYKPTLMNLLGHALDRGYAADAKRDSVISQVMDVMDASSRDLFDDG